MHVALTVSNRPHYLSETLACWSKVRGLDKLDEFVFMVEPTDVATAQLGIIHEFSSAVSHQVNVRVMVNPRIYGVLHNPWEAFETCFKRGAGYTILAEEDLLVSDDILEYHEWARIKYRHDPQIAMNSSFSLHNGAENEVVRQEYFECWIWGTWQDRWYSTLRDSWDHDYSTYNGSPGHESGWDWNINTRIMPKSDMRCIVPVASRSRSIGLYGVHSSPENHVDAPSFLDHRESQDYLEV